MVVRRRDELTSPWSHGERTVLSRVYPATHQGPDGQADRVLSNQGRERCLRRRAGRAVTSVGALRHHGVTGVDTKEHMT